MIYKQQISNFPLDPTIERSVCISKIIFDSAYKAITIDASFEFKKGNDDVSRFYKTKIDNWIVSNRYSISMENPEYYQVDSDGEFILDSEGNKIPVLPVAVMVEVDGVMVEKKVPALDENELIIYEDVVIGQDDNDADIVESRMVMVTEMHTPSPTIDYPAYDYFMSLIFDGMIPLSALLGQWILSDDAKGEFDK